MRSRGSRLQARKAIGFSIRSAGIEVSVNLSRRLSISKAFAILGCMFLALQVRGEDTPLSLEETREVLNSYYRVHGGNARLGALVSIKYEGTLRFGENEESRNFRLFKKRPNLVRYELDLSQGETWILGGNEGNFRQQSRKGRRLSEARLIEDPQQLEVLKHEASFDGLLWNLRPNGRRVSIYPENEDSRLSRYRCEVYTLDPATNRRGDYLGTVWLNAGSYYAEKRVWPSPDGVRIETTFSDYRQVGAYAFAFQISNYSEGALISKTIIEDIEINPGAMDMFFQLR